MSDNQKPPSKTTGRGWRRVPFCPDHPDAAVDIIGTDEVYPDLTITTTDFYCAVCGKPSSFRTEELCI